ncbi:MAG: MBL fold metallo-hydrolase [Candidatus Symbiothrix sp.]|nr:MBL fold metallo-hydrolase [Candidatus Symbiothrix sp.]
MGAGNTQTLIGVTPELIQKYLPDGFRTEVNAFLVKTPEKTILIDAGLGQGLSKNLKTLNVQAGQIDIILLTHMHGDHIGGLLSDEKKVFPNADLFLSKPEYDYWIKSDNKRAKTVLEAYKDRLKLFQPVEPGSKKQNLFPGIQGIAAYGHTPGHTAYLLESGSSKLLIWGDLTHVMAIQMPHPEIAMTYDVDAKQAINSRKKLLEFVAKNNIPVAGMHILFPAVGEVKTDGQGYLFTQKK